MRLSMWALTAALVGMLPPSIALAQAGDTLGRPRAATVQRSAYEYSDYYAQDPPAASPSDAPAEAPATNGNGNGCAKNGCGEEEKNGCGEENGCGGDAPEAWKLINSKWLDCHKINMGGFIQQSYTQNFSSPKDHFNGPVTWLDRSNNWAVNQSWMWLYRDTDTGGYGVDLGGRVDVLYGTDRRFTTAAGLENNWNRDSAFYGVSLPSFYLELAVNDWKIKAGHFISPVGYFTIQTNLNFFNTLPYTYQYGEPFTHTGMLATYNGIKGWSFGGGFIRGWDNFGNFNPNLGFLGTTTRTWDDGSALAMVNVWSNEPNQNVQFTSRYFQTLVYSKPIADNLLWVLQSDFGHQDHAIAATNKGANWYGVNQYLIYTTKNPKWKWAGGFEWFRDEEGFRVGTLLPSLFGSPAPARGWGTGTGQQGYAGNFFQSTWGPQWTPTANIMVRPNLRFDWFSGHQTSFNTNGLRPYDAGRLNHQVMLGTDAIITF